VYFIFNCIAKNASLSNNDEVAKKEASTGDRFDKRVKPNAPDDRTDSFDELASGMAEQWILLGKNILNSLFKYPLRNAQPFPEISMLQMIPS